MHSQPTLRSVRATALTLGLVLAPAALSAQGPAPTDSAAPSEMAQAAETPAAQAEAPARESRVRRNPNLITAQELAESNQTELFSVVQALRPRWLQVRGRASMALSEVVRVYVDGVPAGSPAALRGVQTRSVRSVRYLNGTVASQRYGTDHGAGAILVELL
jgi:hypothetical protein